MQKTGSQAKIECCDHSPLHSLETVFSPPNPPSGPLLAGCMGPFAIYRSSARTGTPKPAGLPRTSPSPTPPACSSFPITTFSACSTARALPWKTWASGKRNWMQRKPARSGSASPSRIISFAARPRACGWTSLFRSCSASKSGSAPPTPALYYDTISAKLASPGLPPPSTLRAIQHRGAGHHQLAAGSADLPPGDPRLRMESPHPAHVSSRFGRRPRIRRLPPERAAARRNARRGLLPLARLSARSPPRPRALQETWLHRNRPRPSDRPAPPTFRPPQPRRSLTG